MCFFIFLFSFFFGCTGGIFLVFFFFIFFKSTVQYDTAGYEYSFPFLTESCGVRVTSRTVGPLYKHLVSIEHPTMAFVGKEDVVHIFIEGVNCTA